MTLADLIRRCRRWRCECGATFPGRLSLCLERLEGLDAA